jgi:hypothetical protein
VGGGGGEGHKNTTSYRCEIQPGIPRIFFPNCEPVAVSNKKYVSFVGLALKLWPVIQGFVIILLPTVGGLVVFRGGVCFLHFVF